MIYRRKAPELSRLIQASGREPSLYPRGIKASDTRKNNLEFWVLEIATIQDIAKMAPDCNLRR